MPLTIELATMPDREHEAAEIWDGDWMIAELHQESPDQLTLELYKPKNGEHTRLSLDEFSSILARARAMLVNSN